MKRCFALALGVVLTLSAARESVAGYPLGGAYWNWGGSVYVSGVRGLPPYFSLFPPVYYSYPVPRTYGYSPFAYPIGSPTPEVTITDVPSKVMVNPYVPQSKAASQSEKSAGGPLKIVNPFVEQRAELARGGK